LPGAPQFFFFIELYRWLGRFLPPRVTCICSHLTFLIVAVPRPDLFWERASSTSPDDSDSPASSPFIVLFLSCLGEFPPFFSSARSAEPSVGKPGFLLFSVMLIFMSQLSALSLLRIFPSFAGSRFYWSPAIMTPLLRAASLSERWSSSLQLFPFCSIMPGP